MGGLENRDRPESRVRKANLASRAKWENPVYHHLTGDNRESLVHLDALASQECQVPLALRPPPHITCILAWTTRWQPCRRITRARGLQTTWTWRTAFTDDTAGCVTQTGGTTGSTDTRAYTTPTSRLKREVTAFVCVFFGHMSSWGSVLKTMFRGSTAMVLTG